MRPTTIHHHSSWIPHPPPPSTPPTCPHTSHPHHARLPTLRSLVRRFSRGSDSDSYRDCLYSHSRSPSDAYIPISFPPSPSSLESLEIPVTPTTPTPPSSPPLFKSSRTRRPLPSTPPRRLEGNIMPSPTFLFQTPPARPTRPLPTPPSEPRSSPRPRPIPQARPTPAAPAAPATPATPTPRPKSPRPRLGPREAALIDVLSRSPETATAALDEYAWHCLLSGMRVREYCTAASSALNGASNRGIRLALAHSPTRMLYPFILPGSASQPATLPPHVLANLTRRQLVDSLLHLGDNFEARALELVLEYIGRRWRLENGDVEAIAKKLAEVEVEIQSSPHGSVLPILQNARIQLGFVSLSFLGDHLQAQSTEAVPATRAWAVRRLSAGIEPQAVAAELIGMRDRLSLPSRDSVTEVLGSLCLDGRTSTEMERPVPVPVRTRTLSRISLRAKRKTLPIPQWLSPRHGKFQPGERRPSLPTISPEGITTPSRVRTPTSPVDRSSPCSTPSSTSSKRSPLVPTPPASPSVSSHPPASALGLSHTEADSRAPLVDHLLSLRYRLGHDSDAWHLGSGHDKALDFLDGMETSPHMKEVVSHLRDAFQLAPAVHTPTTPTFHCRDVSFDLDQYLADVGPIEGDSSTYESNPPSAASVTPGRGRSGSTGSVDTLCSTVTDMTRRFSVVSEFAICEATLAVPVALASYTFPKKGSRDDLVLPQRIKVPEYPRFAKSLPNVADTYTRLPERSLRRRRNDMFPSLDVAATQGLVSFPTPHPCAPNWSSEPNTPSPEAALSPRPTTNDGHHSRRKLYRNCVVVDGRVSPNRSSVSESTALGVVLGLFGAGRTPTPEEVERRLIEAVDIEAGRVATRGDEFDAESRARLAWLLEQVAHELAHPELISAVERVLQRISSPASSPHQSFFRPSGLGLTISVPPRAESRVQLVTSPCSPHSTGSLSPVNTASTGSTAVPAVPFPQDDSTTPKAFLQRRTALRHVTTERVSFPPHTPSSNHSSHTSLPPSFTPSPNHNPITMAHSPHTQNVVHAL